MMATSKKNDVLRVLQDSPGPMSANELWDELRREGCRIGIATIYRVLKSETESGALTSVEFPGGQTRFEPAGRGHHHHFICTSCDRAFDIEGCVRDLKRLAPEHFSVTGHDIVLFGLCASCQEVA